MMISHNSLSSGSLRKSVGTYGANVNEISNKDLENKSQIFAQILRDVGCTKGDPICCVMSKSVDSVIALRGIQYAGGRGMSIAPNWSADRLQAIILDSGTEWIIADEAAKPLFNAAGMSFDSLNIGWMGAVESIPESCLPEFIKDNINNIPLRPVLDEPEKTDAVLGFYGLRNFQPGSRTTFTRGEIEAIASPVLNHIGVDCNSKVGGLMSATTSSILLETLSLSELGDHLYLYDVFNGHYSKLAEDIYQKRITHLFIEADALTKIGGNFIESDICPSVKNIVLWGRTPQNNRKERLQQVFSQSSIYEVSRSSGHGSFNQTPEKSSLLSTVSIGNGEVFNFWKL